VISRRALLGALAGGAAGCALSRVRPSVPSLRLAPVLARPDREIRTVVGLRPFRPDGFVIRAEVVDGRLVVHDYGHGGAGVTLSWGTGELAARLVLAGAERRVAVIGCGAVGLAAARLLQRRGCAVTIYAAALPPETTSDIAGAQIFPFSVYGRGALAGPFREQFVAAMRLSYRAWQALVGPRYGVRWLVNYGVGDEPPDETGLTGRDSPIRDVVPGLVDLEPGEHPFPRRHVRRFHTMLVEPATYLPSVLGDFRAAGGQVVVRRFDAVPQVLALPESVVVNCTGLGAGALFGDASLTPVKGQLTVLLPQPEVDYALLAGSLYMFPRSDGILLGGTHEKGVSSLEPNLEAKVQILDGHARFFAAMAERLA
jgi:glycine/D-amino acid oxidase-like deaminating enzyme